MGDPLYAETYEHYWPGAREGSTEKYLSPGPRQCLVWGFLWHGALHAFSHFVLSVIFSSVCELFADIGDIQTVIACLADGHVISNQYSHQ